jgi:aromatic-L-amino-acid decarboxylase
LRARLREHIRLAQLFAGWVDASAEFERTAPAPFSVVCFRARGPDELNQALLERLNGSGELFLSHTRLDGRFSLRLAIGNLRTTESHVARAWEAIVRHTAELRAAPPH